MLYKQKDVTSMPWYNKNIDFDLKAESVKRNLFPTSHGYKFLDLGTVLERKQ